MESSHGWLFPWCAMAGGAAAFAFALARSSVLSHRPSVSWSKSAFAAWVALTALSVFAMSHLGGILGSDFIPARGILLGALSGALTVWLAAECLSFAQPAGSPGTLTGLRPAVRAFTCYAPLFLGLGTLTVAAARLWLTHSEVTGLTALPLGFAISALTLTPRSRETAALAQYRVGAAMVFITLLCLSVSLGFTRAGQLQEMGWADLPLLLAAVISLGALVGSTLAGAASWAPASATAALTAAAAVILSRGLLHSWKLAALAVAALVTFALLIPLGRSTQGGDNATGDAGLLCGVLIVVVGNVLAFSLWAGYGVALFNLCACALAVWPHPSTIPTTPETSLVPSTSFTPAAPFTEDPVPLLMLGSLGFGAALLVHRTLILGTNTNIRASSMGSTWTLLSIAVGVLVPIAVGAWQSRRQDRAPWLPGIEAIAALVAASLLAGYIWGGRFVGGVLLGIALAPLLAALRIPNAPRMAGTVVAALILGLLQIEIQPWLHTLPDPIRRVRAAIVLFAAALLVLRILIGVTLSARAGRKG